MTKAEALELKAGQTISFKMDSAHELWLKVVSVKMVGDGIKIKAENDTSDASIGFVTGLRVIPEEKIKSATAASLKRLYSRGGRYVKSKVKGGKTK